MLMICAVSVERDAKWLDAGQCRYSLRGHM